MTPDNQITPNDPQVRPDTVEEVPADALPESFRRDLDTLDPNLQSVFRSVAEQSNQRGERVVIQKFGPDSTFSGSGSTIVVPAKDVEKLPYASAAKSLGRNVGELTPYVDPDERVLDLIAQVGFGDRKKRRAAEKDLTKMAVRGDSNDLLDVTNAALVTLIGIKAPGLTTNMRVRDDRQAEVLINTRTFLSDLFRELAKESRNYALDTRRPSTRAKAGFAGDLLVMVDRYFSQGELELMHHGFKHFKYIVQIIKEAENSARGRYGITIPPDVNATEVQRLGNIVGKSRDDISQMDFDLAIKAHRGYYASAANHSGAIQMKFFSDIDEDHTADTLHRFAKSLSSSQPVVHNRAVQILATTSTTVDNYAESRTKWYKSLRNHMLAAVMDPDAVNSELIDSMQTFVANLDRHDALRDFLEQLSLEVDYTKRGSPGNQAPVVTKNEDFIDGILNSQQRSVLSDRLVRAARELKIPAISRDALAELFDERQRLGYFQENLRAHWEELQGITREQIWPSFIDQRQAKLWPSEEEIDTLRFINRHPAAVVGISGIRFYTRGFEPPQVGFTFSFANYNELLIGRLDKDGHMTGLPFDLEEYPHVQAFLEHTAVSAFQELVTEVDHRVKIKGESAKIASASVEQVIVRETSRENPGQLLPRVGTSYTNISLFHEPEERTSDDVVKDAIEREHISRPVSQAIVPLKYAVKYEAALKMANQARQAEDHDATRFYEGQAALFFSQIPNPSAGKLIELPAAFSLASVDGKYVQTWRIAHEWPKPKPGKDPTLKDMYEKRYRAAPIVLTQYLETWFTQRVAAGTTD